jgi:hypothetical protein
MNYKIRHFFPPRVWDPLPYRLDGKKFRQFARETGDFNKEVEKLEIDTSISDDWALMASHSGLSNREFRDCARVCFFTGDGQGLQRMIEGINVNSSRCLK